MLTRLTKHSALGLPNQENNTQAQGYHSSVHRIMEVNVCLQAPAQQGKVCPSSLSCYLQRGITSSNEAAADLSLKQLERSVCVWIRVAHQTTT